MNRYATCAVAAAVLLVACGQDQRDPMSPQLAAAGKAVLVQVTDPADAGEGSFRSAIEAANLDPSITSIVFEPGLGPVALSQPIHYTGGQPLSITGKGAVLDGSGLAPGQSAFVADGGGSLTIRTLTVRKSPGSGMVIDVPDDATGTYAVTLIEVAALENGLHGIIINDQQEYFNDPESASDQGSAAGLHVSISQSRFEGNGFAAIDQDGLRVNEGGPGDLVADIDRTLVLGNGGDGVELDERSTGDVVFAVATSQLNRNGAFSSLDFDDGIDVDEAGEGNIIGRFRDVIANDNFEQGIDINENDAGNIETILLRVEARGNAEEGIEYEEDDDFAGGGNIIADITNVIADGNGTAGGDAGLKLREKGAGDLTVTAHQVDARDNLIGGMQFREDSEGHLFVTLFNATADDNAEDGIDFDENSNGDLTVRLLGVVHASNNGEAGIDAEQASAGGGTLSYVVLDAGGNGDGPIDADAGVVVTSVP